MMEQIIDPPNLNFWALAVIYFQKIFCKFSKTNSKMQLKLESVEGRQK